MTFLFFSLGQNLVHSYGKEFAPGGANSFPYELTLFRREAIMKMAELLPLKLYLLTLSSECHQSAL